MVNSRSGILTGLGVLAGVYLLYRLTRRPVIDEGTSQDIQVPGTLTYPSATYRTLADAIYQAFRITGFGSFTEDDSAVGEALMAMQNDADVGALINAYGVRAGTWLTSDKNLVEAVQAFLDEDIKELVNDNYRAKGINFIWV